MSFDGLFSVGAMEDGVVDIFEGEGWFRVVGMTIERAHVPVDGVHVSRFLERSGCLFSETRIGSIECCDIGDDGYGAIDLWVFRREIWLVKVIRISHIISMNSCKESEREKERI